VRKLCLRVSFTLLTFTIGVFATKAVRVVYAPLTNVPPVREFTSPKTEMPLQPVANDSESSESDQIVKPHIVSISPYEIKRMVESDALALCERNGDSGYVDFGPIWDELSLSTKEDDESIPKRYSEATKATIYNVKLDDRLGIVTVLQVDFGAGIPDSTLYLVFKHTNGINSGAWTLLGALPYIYGPPFVPPTHSVISDRQHRWLVIDYQTGHGSAFGSGADDWFEISSTGVRKVLSYQNGYFLGYGNLAVDRRTRILKIESRDRIITVGIQFETAYGSQQEASSFKLLHLWTNSRIGTFIKAPGMPRFVLDKTHSEISQGEVDPYCSLEDLSNDDILKYNYLDLVKMAVAGNARQESWLRDFLVKCDNSSEKQSLLETLKKVAQ
jgi:hypothetical protein